MTIDPADLHATTLAGQHQLTKIRLPATVYDSWLQGILDAEQVFAVIVKLTSGATVPDVLRVRSIIGQGILTANVKAGDFQLLQDDPTVVSVSLGELLRAGAWSKTAEDLRDG